MAELIVGVLVVAVMVFRTYRARAGGMGWHDILIGYGIGLVVVVVFVIGLIMFANTRTP